MNTSIRSCRVPAVSRLRLTRALRLPGLLAIGLVFAAAGMATAGPLYWSGSGTWDNAASVDWGTSSAGPYNVTIWLGGSDANFVGSPGAVIVSGSVASVRSMTFSADGYTLNGGSIGMTTSGGSINVAPGGTATINSLLTGTVGLTLAGGGALTLGAGNPYTGNTAVSAGTLTLDGTTSSPQITIGSAAVLDLNGAISNNANTIFAGSGILRKTGTGQVIWGASSATFNLLAGSLIDVQAGTFVGGSSENEVWTNNLSSLNVAAGATFLGVEANVKVDALTGSGTIASGYPGAGYAAFTFGVNGGSGTFAGVLADGGASANFVKAGSGSQVLTGGNTFTGQTTISGGTLQLGSSGSGASIASTSAVVNNGSLVFNHSDNISFAPVISGSGSLMQTGSGALTLTGNNTYSGLTTVSGGTLQIGSGGSGASIGNTSGVVNNGSLIFNHADNITFAPVISGSGTLTHSGAGMLTLTASNAYTGATTISSGTLTIGNGGSGEGLASSTITSNAALIFNPGDSLTYAGVINGSGSVTAQGNTVVLTGSNTYTGVTTISGGTLSIGNGGSGEHPASPTIVNNGALEFNFGDSLTYAGAISGGGDLTLAGSGMVTLTGSNTFGGNTTISSGTLQIPVGRVPAVEETLGGSGTATVVQSGGVNSVSDFFKVGLFGASATYLLSGSGRLSTYRDYVGYGGNGVFTQTGGTHTVSTIMEVGVIYPGTYQLAGGLLTASEEDIGFDAQGALTQSGGTNSVGSLEIDDFGSSGTYILNGGLLTVAGMSANGPNVFLFSGGTLRAAADLYSNVPMTLASSGSGPIFDSNGNTLTIAAALSGSGGFQKIGAGTLLLTASNNYTGPTLVSAGTLQIGNGGSGASIGGTSNIVNNASLVFNNSDSAVLAAAITGSGSLTKMGSGSLLLAASNSNLGNTTVNGGTLGLGQIVLSQAAAVRIAAGADMNLGFGGTDLVAALYLNGVPQNPGLYGASNDAAYFSGAGQLKVLASPAVWNVSSPYFGDWNTAGNWAGGLVPTGSGSIATFNNTVAGATAAITNVPITVGMLNLASSSRIDITGVNQGALVMQADPSDPRFGGIAQINVSGGSLAKLSLPLTFDSPATISIAGGSTLEIGNPLNLNGQTVVKTGAGTLQLDVNFSAAGGTLQANAGAVALGSEAIVSPAMLDIAGNAQLTGSGTIEGAVTYESSAASTFAGSIAGAATSLILDTASGRLTLSGTNAFGGGTFVEGGELILTNAHATADGSNIAVGNPLAFANPVVVAAQVLSSGAVTPVPEPSTLALFVAAVCGAAVYGVPRRFKSTSEAD